MFLGIRPHTEQRNKESGNTVEFMHRLCMERLEHVYFSKVVTVVQQRDSVCEMDNHQVVYNPFSARI